MLKGLVERAEHYNKSVDQRTMTDARIAFGMQIIILISRNSSIIFPEEEQLKNGKSPNAGTSGMENLADSGTHVPRRGRGDYFGKLRSFVGLYFLFVDCLFNFRRMESVFRRDHH